MLNPWYKRKKVWIAVVTVVANIVADLSGHPELKGSLTTIGGVLIGSFGLEDFGKAQQ